MCSGCSSKSWAAQPRNPGQACCNHQFACAVVASSFSRRRNWLADDLPPSQAAGFVPTCAEIMPGWDTRGRAALELTIEDRGRSNRTRASPAFSTRLSTALATQTDRIGWLQKTGNQSSGPCLLTLVETNGHLTRRARKHHRACSRGDSRSAQFDWTATHLQHPFRKIKAAV